MLNDVAVSLTCSGLYYMFGLFIWKRKEVESLVRALGDYTEFGKPDGVEAANRSFNFFSKLYYLYCVFGASIYFVLTQTVEMKDCTVKNEKYERSEVCGLLVNIWLPFEHSVTPIYETIVFTQFLAGIYCAPVLTISFMVFIMQQHLNLKIGHLKGMVRSIFEGQDARLHRDRLNHCIRYHQHIVILCKEFNSCFGQIMFLYITFTSATLSVTGYQVLEVKPFLRVTVNCLGTGIYHN